MTRRLLRRACGTIALVAVVAALIGATAQGVLTALERRRFARPGRMVDVGTHQLHVRCTGTVPARVVLEAPLGSLSAHWQDVQAALAPHVGVCSYDRSGLGWSERGEASFSPDDAVRELEALLRQVAGAGPVVLVGEGFGAALAETFAHRHPGHVSALVLTDWPAASARPSIRSPWLARIGLLRLFDWLSGSGTAPGATGGGVDVIRAFGYRPDHLTRSAAELEAWDRFAQPRTGNSPSGLRVRRVEASPGSPQYVDAVVGAVLELAP